MATALVYHEDMTAARLLWDDPECELERPERLAAVLSLLRLRGLEQRCLRLSACEASEAELGLVHSPEYVALVRETQTLDEDELRALSEQYDAVYFHPSTFHCARLAVGAALQLVDAVLTGAAPNGLALVRPPGHHSHRAAANGFCVFNNVAIAAKHAKQKHGLHRILIVDWDVHHGQGIQYIFEDDPSVLYFSWHRYEYGRFWPFLRESDADAVGQGQGRGFTVNLPWNQVGMGNADYLAAFLHVLLPLAFEFNPELVLVSAGFDSAIGDPEGQMQATPECFAHLTQLLQVLAGGRVCAVLEGGYHLDSLSESVCMTVQALLGDPGPVLQGSMEPCQSALESIQSVRAAQAPHWTSLQQGRAPGPSPSICPTEGRPLPLLPGGPTGEAAALGLLGFHPTPASPVHMAVALTGPSATLALSPEVLLQEEVSVGRQETEAWARWAGQAWGGASVLCLQLMYCQLVHLFLWLAHHRQHESLTQDKALSALGKFLFLADGILNGKVTCGIAAIPACAKAATLDVAIRQSLSRGAQRLLCLVLGELDWPLDIADDGRILWLNIGGKETAVRSAFHISTPLPGTTGGFLNYTLGLVLPLAYSFQPELVLVTVGPAQGLQDPHVALLAAMLRIPAAGRVLALLEEESASQLVTTLAPVLHGEAPPSLGPFLMASPEDIQTLKCLRAQLEPRWKLLQVASEAQGEAGSCHRVPLGKPPSGTNYTDQACS
ncbi:PREDICTED: histone deacetylase 10 isoform X2 [Dipodomys ordii]|uniref:Histone deacetylase 10 isoform X2 n=1 Tax=Dipodomys ordii TaxID=10020 RepID=A0A1S3FXW3_DIPOR|nr:PREDICTED: histone deacetylase 10 isoform X2 [Dipodomys ordii]